MAKNENSKVVAILSYFVVGIIWYFVDDKLKKDAFAKFHVKQALNLIIISVIVNVVLSSFVFWLMLWPIWSLIRLALTVLWIFGIIYAIQDKKQVVPIVGQFAEKYLTF